MRRMETSGRYAIFEDDTVAPRLFRVYEDDTEAAAFRSYAAARDYVRKHVADPMPTGERRIRRRYRI